MSNLNETGRYRELAWSLNLVLKFSFQSIIKVLILNEVHIVIEIRGNMHLKYNY